MTTNNVGSTGAAQASESTAPAAKRAGVDKETFLQLLVAQIKNQNPLNPADGVQFLTQLAQFSELEQMMEIRSELTAIREQIQAANQPSNTENTGASSNV